MKRYEGRQEEEPIDPKLESIVNRMFKRCFEDREYKQAIGIALETRRNDILQKAILDSVSKLQILIECTSSLLCVAVGLRMLYLMYYYVL